MYIQGMYMHVGKTTAGVNVTYQSMYAYNMYREIITHNYGTFYQLRLM